MSSYAEKTNYCVCCKKKLVENSFYKSNSILASYNNNRMFVCKNCVSKVYDELAQEIQDSELTIYKMCQILDVYYSSSLAKSAVFREQSTVHIMKYYMQKVNSLPHYSSKNFSDTSDHMNAASDLKEKKDNMEFSEEDIHNMNEVISLIHYDPFKDDPPKDRPYLYNTILNYLNPNTIKDSFKLSSIIEVTRMFCQLNNINDAINNMLEDNSNIEAQTAKLKSFMDIKKSLNLQIVSFARQNGIASSKEGLRSGADTLSGIIMDLKSKKIALSDTNYMDIKSAEAYQKISEINMKSILEQLMLSESEYIDMIKDSREYIDRLDKDITRLEDENYKLKLKNHFLLKEMEKRGFEVEFK